MLTVCGDLCLLKWWSQYNFLPHAQIVDFFKWVYFGKLGWIVGHVGGGWMVPRLFLHSQLVMGDVVFIGFSSIKSGDEGTNKWWFQKVILWSPLMYTGITTYCEHCDIVTVITIVSRLNLNKRCKIYCLLIFILMLM